MITNKIKKLGLLHLIFGIALLISLPTIAHSEANWQTLMTAKIGVAKNKFTIGQHAKATDGMDNYYDVTAMLSGDITAYLESSKGPLWQEIKGLGAKKLWTLKVDSNLTGKVMEITINRSYIPKGYTIFLHDKTTGSTTNLTQRGSYRYTHSGARTFSIESVGVDVAGTENNEEEAENNITAENNLSENNSTANTGSSSGFFRGAETDKRNNPNSGKNRYRSKASSRNVASEYKSYYKTSTTKIKAQVAGLLKKPSNLRGWVKKNKGIYLEWDDNSGGEHGFIVEKNCAKNNNKNEKKEWSLIAALWGVRPNYSYKRTTLKIGSSCQYRVIAFNHRTESDYSDIVSFTDKGEILVVEEKNPTTPTSLVEEQMKINKEQKTNTVEPKQRVKKILDNKR